MEAKKVKENLAARKGVESNMDFLEELRSHSQKFLSTPSVWLKLYHHQALFYAVLALSLAGTALGLWWWRNLNQLPESTVLTDYLPRDAWLYVEFKLEPSQWQALTTQAPSLAGSLNNFFLEQGLNQTLINQASRLALVATFDSENLVWSWLIGSSQPRSLELFLQPGFYYRQIGSQVSVIASQSAGVKVFDYQPSELRLDDQSFWSGFFRSNLAGQKLGQLNNSLVYQAVLSQWLKRWPAIMFFKVELTPAGLALVMPPDEITTASWPQFNPGWDIMIDQTNLARALSELEAALVELPLPGFYWQEFKQRTARDFRLDWFALRSWLEKDARLILDYPGALSELWPDQNIWQVSNWRWLVDWPTTAELTEQAWLESQIKNLAGFIEPEERQVKLPDGSRSFDLIFNPDRLTFVTQTTDEGVEKVLVLPVSQENFFLLFRQDSTILANDRALLTDYLAQEKFLNITCGAGEESVYLSPAMLKLMPFLASFQGVLITAGPESFNVCFRT